MAASATTENLRSPKHKLVKFFQEHRDKWRSRSHENYKKLRAMTVTARDLRKSRDLWKEKFLRERQARLQLEAQLGHPPPKVNQLARRTPALTGQPTS